MGRIRIIGRREQARCVYCHDLLQDDVYTCRGCAATFHPGCRTARPECPTIGCGAVVWTARRVTPRSARRSSTGGAGLLARLGPYSRLIASFLVHVLLTLGLTIGAPWLVLQIAGVDPRLAVLSSALGIPAVYLLARWAAWLMKIPWLLQEVGRLLDETRPIPMRLRVYQAGGSSYRGYLLGSPRGGERRQLRFDLDGLLTPWWLQRDGLTRDHVWVYGTEGPGPYVLQFEDGWLALVQPD